MQIGTRSVGQAASIGAAPALIDGERVLTFAEFDDLTDRLGTPCLARGLQEGDRVAVLMPNGIDGVVAYYALAKAGLVRVPLNTVRPRTSTPTRSTTRRPAGWSTTATRLPRSST